MRDILLDLNVEAKQMHAQQTSAQYVATPRSSNHPQINANSQLAAFRSQSEGTSPAMDVSWLGMQQQALPAYNMRFWNVCHICLAYNSFL